MSIPKNVKIQLLTRFDQLIAEGQDIVENAEDVPPRYDHDDFGRRFIRQSGYQVMDGPKFVEWRIKATTLLSKVIPDGSIHAPHLEKFSSLNAYNAALSNLEEGISFVRAIKDDFERGFLDDLLLQIEAEIASDYMGQAENLLTEGSSGKYDHVPAAVLVGAVLEKALRKMCDSQQPPILKSKPNGEPKTLNPLIDELKASGVYK